MSDDEILVTIAAVVTGPVLWALWLLRVWRLPLRPEGKAGRLAITNTLGVSTLVIYAVLRTAASFDVMNAPQYVFMYIVLGLAWLRAAEKCFPCLGVSVRDDVLERGNRAATPALAGALLGATFCYAGGNIGDGPGWWVVVFAAGLATVTWLLSWLALVLFAHAADVVAIDRDRSAGIRLGAFLAATGLVMGRGVAGNWVSTSATIDDFVVAALPPALLVLALALFIEHRARPTPERPQAPVVAWGLVPAAVYLTLAIVAVARLGQP